MIPYSKEAYRLLHQGAIALAQVEKNGLRMDEAYLKSTIRKTEQRIKFLKGKMKKGKVAKMWHRVYGHRMNIGSNDQLGDILFHHMGYEPTTLTATGKPKTDEKALMAVKDPFVEQYLEIKKLEKALSTYLLGLQREIVDGILRPMYNLHIASTYRSSSNSPNFQNIPVRNEKIAKMIRSAFLARPGRHLVELDYKGIEVAVAACYHKDPTMIEYIQDKTKDMHRDMAIECYKLKRDQVTKKIRYAGKNMFVFPQFYGDWYIDCARSLWEGIDTMKLRTEDGIPLKRHLQWQGITELGDLNPKEKPRRGTFERHIQRVEKDFWGRRFPMYAAWKKRWYKAYSEKGWFKTKTGFVCQGFMKRNEVINYPIQGSAFHCLLWSLIQLVLKGEMRRRKMRTLIVGQIHDSLLADVPHEELDDFLHLAKHVMVDLLRKHWRWIIAPLEIEAEVTPINGSWAEKEEMEIE